MKIDVVYLAYLDEEKGYTLKTVETFLKSYNEFSAGIDNSLVIIAKNWIDKNLLKDLYHIAEKAKAKIIELPNNGWDIGAYFRIIRYLDSDYILFLGSSTKILTNNWLLKLYKPLEDDKSIQLTGSMGSWERGITNLFPNPHIRTCCFMIKKSLFSEYASAQKFPITKKDTYDLEHGKNSLTNFILNKGYKAVVVNNEGEVFEPKDWMKSETYRNPTGFKAIISDKQSNNYFISNDEKKSFLEYLAWGGENYKISDTQIRCRTDIINYLIKKNNFRSYLEIGLNNPFNNFLKIKCEEKISVDPYIPTNRDDNTEENINMWLKYCTYRMSSDEFFKTNKKNFDLIFIDGLHEEQQVDKDIYNSLKCLNRGGFIIIHDCLPPTKAHQEVPRPESAGLWNGDVWKSFVKIALLKDPNLKVFVIDLDWGCGVIQKLNDIEYEMPDLLDMPWEFFNDNKHNLLEIIDKNNVITKL